MQRRRGENLENTVWLADKVPYEHEKGKHFFSFDPGETNLGFCNLYVVEETQFFHLVRWEVITLECKGTETIPNTAQVLLNYLRGTSWQVIPNQTMILIEDQPPTNLMTFALSYCIYTFFHCTFPHLPIHFVNSKIKLNLCDELRIQATRTYAKQHGANKALAKEAVRTILTHCPNQQTELFGWFQRQRKQDDLADSFLQTLAWYNLHGHPQNFIVRTVLSRPSTSLPLLRQKATKRKKPVVGMLKPGT